MWPFVQCIRSVCAMCSLSPSPSFSVRAAQFLFAINAASWLIWGETVVVVVAFAVYFSLYRRHAYRSAVRMQLFCLSQYNFQRFFCLWFCGVKMRTASHWCVVFLFIYFQCCCCPDFHVIFLFVFFSSLIAARVFWLSDLCTDSISVRWDRMMFLDK